MINKVWQPKKVLVGIVSFWMCAVLQVRAQGQQQLQPRPAAASSSTAGSRPYVPNGTIGDAVISSDPDTKQITVIADEETAGYIKQVISGLDRPKPQVLIKVVFLEVEYDNASDIGVEGNITGKLRVHDRYSLEYFRPSFIGRLPGAAGRRALYCPGK